MHPTGSQMCDLAGGSVLLRVCLAQALAQTQTQSLFPLPVAQDVALSYCSSAMLANVPPAMIIMDSEL